MEIPRFLETLASQGVLIGWAAILLVYLLFLLSGLRQAPSKKSRLWMICLILIILAGQFMGFSLYYIPKVTRDLKRENWKLTEKVAALNVEKVTRDDLVLAYKTENEALGELIRGLRARPPDAERQVSAKAGDNRNLIANVSRPEDANTRSEGSFHQNVRSEGKHPQSPDLGRRLVSQGLRAGEWVAARELSSASDGNASYAVTLLTANSNRELVSGIEALLREEKFTMKDPVPVYTTSNRIVFFSAADLRKAEEIAAAINSRFGLSLGLKLSPDPNLERNFNISISP